ncbi:HD-GYP domain-containing protein [Streptomyces flavofungini]|uniref:HD-GYP domain-containing protein n=1 Tax=Streptomyces flavofungini TaxID=68200 RepID=A0ABS0XG30_9ACTN|nr:HD-GYP domain-containing protein [Streptomyces flavofungini]MBJ3812150.1 HD-GYP domain-containing protein [Streptomyces flavofungini]GHC47658.1 metal-dependent phosphohydrolase [Streptomyces flavofungini]
MRSVPARARGYVIGVALGGAACVAPALGPGTRWTVVALLAALYAGGERAVRHEVAARTFFPVLLAGVFLLPPAAAALVAVPGALCARVERQPRRLRRAWRAAQLALAAWAAGQAYAAFDGPAAASAPDFPYVLLPAAAAVLAFAGVLAALDGGILVTAERVPARTAWRGLLPRSLAPVAVHGLAGLMMAVLWQSPYGPPAALLVLLPMGVSCWVFAQYHRERAAHQATIRALVQAVDLKDRYTRGHSERVGRAAVLIARELGMDDARVEVLRFAGILHDVGKLGVPTRLLRKDGPLTPQERRVIELHPEYGHEMVRGIGFLGDARAAILHHHERIDGSGYPYGLTGTQIPESARVVAVADAFDAMTSSRSYRRARPVPAAVAELERCAGVQFDAEMVGALVRALARHGWDAEVTAGGGAEEREPGGPEGRGAAGPGGGSVTGAAPAAVVSGSGSAPGGDARRPEAYRPLRR